MNLNFQGKVYIVTGGASGIGSAVCRLIGSENGTIVIADRDAVKNKTLLAELRQAGISADAVTAELTNDADCRNIVDTTMQTYGRIDGLVNNAGVNDGVSLQAGSVKAFRDSLNLNLVQYFAMACYALPYLKESRGCIVNVGSKVSVTGQGGTSGYAASKGGINALTREWAAELLPLGIRVNAVLPK